MIEHKEHPFPKSSEINELAALTNLTFTQVVNWTTNVRKRNLKGTVEGGKKPHHFMDFLFLAENRDKESMLSNTGGGKKAKKEPNTGKDFKLSGNSPKRARKSDVSSSRTVVSPPRINMFENKNKTTKTYPMYASPPSIFQHGSKTSHFSVAAMPAVSPCYTDLIHRPNRFFNLAAPLTMPPHHAPLPHINHFSLTGPSTVSQNYQDLNFVRTVSRSFDTSQNYQSDFLPHNSRRNLLLNNDLYPFPLSHQLNQDSSEIFDDGGKLLSLLTQGDNIESKKGNEEEDKIAGGKSPESWTMDESNNFSLLRQRSENDPAVNSAFKNDMISTPPRTPRRDDEEDDGIDKDITVSMKALSDSYCSGHLITPGTSETKHRGNKKGIIFASSPNKNTESSISCGSPTMDKSFLLDRLPSAENEYQTEEHVFELRKPGNYARDSSQTMSLDGESSLLMRELSEAMSIDDTLHDSFTGSDCQFVMEI